MLVVSVFPDNVVMAKVGISSVSVENALENLDASLPGWDFEAYEDRLPQMPGRRNLAKIRIKSDDPSAKDNISIPHFIIQWWLLHFSQTLMASSKVLNGDDTEG